LRIPARDVVAGLAGRRRCITAGERLNEPGSNLAEAPAQIPAAKLRIPAGSGDDAWNTEEIQEAIGYHPELS
jgi:hypothetical protein